MSAVSKSKTWAAVILTALALSGCQASRVAPVAEQPASVTVSHTSVAAQTALLSLPGTTPVQATGYQATGCMDFGWGGSSSPGDTVKFIALGIVLSPLLIVIGALYLLHP